MVNVESQWKEEKWPPKTGSLADEEHFSRFLHGTLCEVGENARKVRLLCRLRANFWLLTRMFSLLLSLTLEALING